MFEKCRRADFIIRSMTLSHQATVWHHCYINGRFLHIAGRMLLRKKRRTIYRMKHMVHTIPYVPYHIPYRGKQHSALVIIYYCNTTACVHVLLVELAGVHRETATEILRQGTSAVTCSRHPTASTVCGYVSMTVHSQYTARSIVFALYTIHNYI